MDLSRRVGVVPLLVLRLLADCAGHASSYGARDWRGVGYDQAEIEPGVYFLDYTGDQYHSMAMVVGYWHRRAKELCPNGFTPVEHQPGVSPGESAVGAGLFQQSRYTGYIRCNK
jgi:hypothetical protein